MGTFEAVDGNKHLSQWANPTKLRTDVPMIGNSHVRLLTQRLYNIILVRFADWVNLISFWMQFFM